VARKIGGYNVSLDGLDIKGDADRIERSKDCEARGWHRPTRPPTTQSMKAGPGKVITAELCRDCGVWIGPGHHWDSPEDVDAAHR
jgi:hypothetical protein